MIFWFFWFSLRPTTNLCPRSNQHELSCQTTTTMRAIFQVQLGYAPIDPPTDPRTDRWAFWAAVAAKKSKTGGLESILLSLHQSRPQIWTILTYLIFVRKQHPGVLSWNRFLTQGYPSPHIHSYFCIQSRLYQSPLQVCRPHHQQSFGGNSVAQPNLNIRNLVCSRLNCDPKTKIDKTV